MGVSVQGISAQGISVQMVSVQGVSVQDGGDLCSRGVSVRETPVIVKCGEYASYWNAFLFLVNSN